MSTHTGDGGQNCIGFLPRKAVVWASWDVGPSALNSVVTIFVFSVYLITPKLFRPSANANLGWAMVLAGILVMLTTPAFGQWTDRAGKTHAALAAMILALAALTGAMFFIKPSGHHVRFSLLLLAASNFIFEVGSVIRNPMVSDTPTPENAGRVPGFGWDLGCIGSILLLFSLLVGFIQSEAGFFSATGEDALNTCVSMAVCILWTLIFCLPLLLTSHSRSPSGEPPHGLFGSYADFGRSIVRLWHEGRSAVWFFVSSAICRNGLVGVFTFGGVLADIVLGFKRGEVIMFGVAANLVANVTAAVFDRLDDRIDPRRAIVDPLAPMCVLALIVSFGKPAGPVVFWVFGLALCVFVGPT